RQDREDVKNVVLPLGLGQMSESHFVLVETWKQHLERKRAQAGGEVVTVRQLRAWMDEPEPRGLSRPVQDLVAMTYALQTNRSFVQLGATVQPEIGALHPEMELHEQALPAPEVWGQARATAESILGVLVGPARNATTVR